MLKVDLARLARQRRLRLHALIPAEDALWHGSGIHFTRPLDVRLEAQKVGADVLVSGSLDGEALLECRRCLRDVRVPLNEEVTALYRSGVGPVEAERDEVYPLPARGQELELGEMVREQVLLAVPRFALCSEACKGLCPRCGADRNEGECGCEATDVDERWGPLRALRDE